MQARRLLHAKSADDVARELWFDRVAPRKQREPRPPSPAALEAAAAAQGGNRYPDTRASALVEALRRYHGDYRFVTGAGMDGVIETVIRTVVEPGEKVAVSTHLLFYALRPGQYGAEVVNIPAGKILGRSGGFAGAARGRNLPSSAPRTT